MKQLIAISLFILTLAGCKKGGDLFKSYGPETTEKRQVASFRAISAGEKFDIELKQDSAREGEIELTAGANVISGYETRVENGVLVLENTNKFNWVRQLKVRQKVVIYFRVIDSLSVRGSAKFVANDTIYQKNKLQIIHNGLEDVELNIRTNDINLRGENTGGIILRGRCNIFNGTVDDVSFIDNRNLITDDTYFTSFSQEASYVEAKNILGIKVYGNGNVYYSSDPANSFNSKFEAFGKGQIIKQ
ncbi:MAG: DUF2807 domain-containing protein [Bacteroidota bacterium]